MSLNIDYSVSTFTSNSFYTYILRDKSLSYDIAVVDQNNGSFSGRAFRYTGADLNILTQAANNAFNNLRAAADALSSGGIIFIRGPLTLSARSQIVLRSIYLTSYYAGTGAIPTETITGSFANRLGFSGRSGLANINVVETPGILLNERFSILGASVAITDYMIIQLSNFERLDINSSDLQTDPAFELAVANNSAAVANIRNSTIRNGFRISNPNNYSGRFDITTYNTAVTGQLIVNGGGNFTVDVKQIRPNNVTASTGPGIRNTLIEGYVNSEAELEPFDSYVAFDSEADILSKQSPQLFHQSSTAPSTIATYTDHVLKPTDDTIIVINNTPKNIKITLADSGRCIVSKTHPKANVTLVTSGKINNQSSFVIPKHIASVTIASVTGISDANNRVNWYIIQNSPHL